MNFRLNVLLILALLTSVSVTALGQMPTEQDDEKIVVGSAEVPVDASVRDKRGRPVKDLTIGDFEVYEDGVRQQINSLRLIALKPGASGTVLQKQETTGRTATLNDAVAGIGSVALVFDRLSLDARSRAREAALTYARGEWRTNDFVGIFLIDLSLRVLQPYTDDAQLIRRALDRARSQTLTTSPAGEIAVEGSPLSAPRAPSESSSPGNEGDIAQQKFDEMMERSFRGFERLERERQGHATIDGLLGVINSLRPLPGRKAVVFFSEGMVLPPAVQGRFNSLITDANRADISFYTVDAAGLRTESIERATGREVGQVIGALESNAQSELTSSLGLLERMEDRLASKNGLRQLARATGGFHVGDTNNLGKGLNEIGEDLHTFYLLTYVPQNPRYDGRFRRIEVKLARPNLEVENRKGYYAINALNASPVLPYEAPALDIAASGSGAGNRPNAFTVRTASLSFPEPARPGLVSVFVEVPGASVTHAVDKGRKLYRTNFSVLMLIRDEQQQVIKKESNQYLLSGTLDRLGIARQGSVLFYRQPELAPGRYTIESIVYDALARKASMRTESVEVLPGEPTGPRISSLVIIKRAEPIKPAGKSAGTPFQFGDVLLYPNLGEPLSKQSAKQIAFFCVVHLPKSAGVPGGGTTAPQVLVEVRQHNRTIGSTSSPLPPPDANNRVQHASALPLDGFQPGTYELRITVRGAQGSVSRSAQFTVEP
ncbi:MAG: VWA domain-containing protein [Acidobacteriota bacterium]|nr:VWA domain-containing protein [Acidobacteriota bacterium]